MVNYNNAKLYKIIDNTTDNIYIGSTCEPTLARRLAGHVSKYKRYLQGKSIEYVTSFKILENEDYDIVLICNYPCRNKDELHQLERRYIEDNICVNKCIPTRTQKEYHQNNKVQRNQQIKEYHQKNKEKIHKRKNQKHDCCCGGNYTSASKARHCRTKQHVTFMNNKIERQYQYCVELYETTKNLLLFN
jgi:hypothetical protein